LRATASPISDRLARKHVIPPRAGSAQGSDDFSGNPIGEAHFVGEGGYEGLEFHYYVTEPIFGEGAHLMGWISESTPADAASATAAVTPFHAIPATSTRVSGTAACDSTGSGTIDPQGELDVLVTCQLSLSDPRVSGSETQDRVRILAGDVGAGDVRVAEDARITTSEGTWRGRVQAATDDAAVPAAIGEAHYIGEGAYEGLEFHYYFADLDSAEGGPVAVHGWISPAPLTAALVSLTHAGKQWARGRDGSRPPSGSAPCPEDTVLYRINDTRHEVVVLRIDRRRDAYRPS
jgi:hypothetical protein